MTEDFTRNRDLYSRVGTDYSWIDRLGWSDRQWRAWADRVETHVVELRGTAIGYFELEPEPKSTKVAIFGLLGGYHGRGLGGHALTMALRRGFELGPRVWLTTCSLDSPAALPNYRARGLEVFKVEERPWSPRVLALPALDRAVDVRPQARELGQLLRLDLVARLRAGPTSQTSCTRVGAGVSTTMRSPR